MKEEESRMRPGLWLRQQCTQVSQGNHKRRLEVGWSLIFKILARDPSTDF
jgi:hypothetical protein